jgi:hypothetical protein
MISVAPIRPLTVVTMNRALCSVLVILGAVLLFGVVTDHAGALALVAYVGWLVAVFSVFAYLGGVIRSVGTGGTSFWVALYPVNFGLVLIGASFFGTNWADDPLVGVVLLVVGVGLAVVLTRPKLTASWYLPAALLGVAMLPLLPAIARVWPNLYLLVGGFLLGMWARMRQVSRNSDSAK